MVATEAIVVRNAKKRYGNTRVLDGLNLTVSRGSIYGLLGASGCGKTTLLSCVVGVKKLDSGEVWVLGGQPGTKGSGIPGPRVGYMPQDISLVQEFTVIGALYYFGRINGLEDHEIEERHVELAELFQLPPMNRMMKEMSGGQKRRVSFAAALIHRPELLILDEPTVGLDPVLREKIWQFLVKITQDEGVTVIITTHYIEETKSANCIGLMRCGQLLAEASPSQLLARFQCESLEEAFLTLSQQQNDNQTRGIANVPTLVVERDTEVQTPVAADQESQCLNDYNRNQLQRKHQIPIKSPWYLLHRRFKALMNKNVVQILRHPGGLLFAFLLPFIQVGAFFGAINGDPNDVNIAIVNEEAGNCNFGRNKGNIIYESTNGTCDFIDLSCRFLDKFDDSIAKKAYYDSLPEAYEAVKNGDAAATMFYSRNFSSALQHRLEDISGATTADIVAGQIQVWLDMGDRQIGLYLEKRLFERFFEIYREVVAECKIEPRFGDMPVRIEEPIFGSKQQKYAAFVAPGFLLTLVFFLATAVSSSIIITDRYEGIWDRSLVQGVKTAEILVAHILTQVTIISIQVMIAMVLGFLFFGLKCKGSIVTVTCLMLGSGLSGMCYGFLISVVCGSHTMANYLSIGSFYPMILLSGCIWPIEGMPKFLYYLSIMIPTTIPSVSMRAVMEKGYTVNNPQVYHGFMIVAGWIVCLFSLCLVGLRTKHG